MPSLKPDKHPIWQLVDTLRLMQLFAVQWQHILVDYGQNILQMWLDSGVICHHPVIGCWNVSICFSYKWKPFYHDPIVKNVLIQGIKGMHFCHTEVE